MPKGKPKAETTGSNLIAASAYRAPWWGAARDEPSDETLARVRRYVTHEADPDRLSRFTAAEVAAACNLSGAVAHYELDALRAEGVLTRRREPITGMGATTYVWARANGAGAVRQIGAARAANDAVPLAEVPRLLGVSWADAVRMARNGVLAIDEAAGGDENGGRVAVRRADVARARWWVRHKDAPYAERHLPPVYVVPPLWAERLAALTDDESKREGA